MTNTTDDRKQKVLAPKSMRKAGSWESNDIPPAVCLREF